MSSGLDALLWYPGHEIALPDIVRAENCAVYDGAGKRYVDLESGVWCTPLGHGHPRVLAALTEQAARLAHTGYAYSSGVVAEAAAELLARLGLTGGRCVFLTAGSEAVEYAVRTAQMLSERPLLLTMSDSYFGAYGSASRRRPDEWVTYDWLARGDCGHGEDCDARCAHWAALPLDAIGGLLLEPGSSSGLVRFPPLALVRRLAARIQGEGGLLLVNEVTTGMGRTGRWFGFEHYGLAPDAVALGKGLGNGYPVSATGFSARAAARLGARTPSYAQSHQNDPLGAAVALAVLRTLAEEKLIERGLAIGGRLVAGLERVRAESEHIAAIRSRGAMIAVDIADDGAATRATWVQRELLARGYILARRPGLSTLRIDPAFTIAEADIDAFLAAFGLLLREAP